MKLAKDKHKSRVGKTAGASRNTQKETRLKELLVKRLKAYKCLITANARHNKQFNRLTPKSQAFIDSLARLINNLSDKEIRTGSHARVKAPLLVFLTGQRFHPGERVRSLFRVVLFI
ncbi:hypothetical protein DID80_05650 [Candidatus Marinamargulisbacteria bacterium SCGC AAA071-K20]|nr:hypothetical protein DID80_05650 [Candidatus Marinamargulisbacteria bacterium SCGC AAA071-K20]